MVTAAFILLVAFNPHVMKPWIAVLVIGREFLVSGLRSIASSEGFTIQASDLGKLKTVVQIVAVVAAILNHRWDTWLLGWFPISVRLIAITATYWMTILSIISATRLLRRLLEQDRPRLHRQAPPQLRPKPQQETHSHP